MEQLKVINHLREIAPAYKALLCDAWGVLHNGVALFDGVETALVNFRKHHGPVLILTNAPRPSDIIPAQLDRLGLSREAYDGVVTSGDAIRAEIINRLPAPIYRLGPEKDDPLFKGLDLNFTALEEAEYIVCTGLFDELGERVEDYTDLLQRGVARNIEMICANPDIVVRLGDQLIYCAGALAALYQKLGGRVIHGGKPHKPIYRLALEQLRALAPDLADRSILAIGDGLDTDIAGANRQGLDALYIYGGGGVHDQQGGSAGDILRAANAEAVGAMERVIW